MVVFSIQCGNLPIHNRIYCHYYWRLVCLLLCNCSAPPDDYYRYHVPASQVTIPPLSDAALINGKGRYAGGPPSPLAVVTVRPGIRYRLRLVAISCDPNYVFSIDGHNFTVIETDGVNTQPLPVDSIQIFAGSFDFLQPLNNLN